MVQIFVSIAITFIVSTAQAADYAARVVSVEGTTLIRQDKGSDNPKPLKVGEQVFPGQVINTGSKARVKLLFADKSIVDIGPSSLFKISEYKANQGDNRQVDVEMKYGSVRAAITEKIKNGGHFRVKTPTATMGVRGTEFLVKADQTSDRGPAAAGGVEATRTQMIVLQGAVESQAMSGGMQNVMVTPGTAIESGVANTQVKAIDLGDSKVQKEVASYTVQPNTFAQAIGVSENSDSKGSSGLGESTLAVVKEAVKQTGPTAIPLSATGLLQNQNPANWILQDRNLTQGVSVPITVRVNGF